MLQFLDSQDSSTTYEGTVTGTTTSGAVFITLDKFLVDGMVRPDDMPGQQETRIAMAPGPHVRPVVRRPKWGFNRSR